MKSTLPRRGAAVYILLLAGCLLLLPHAGFAQTVSFGTATNFTVGPNPPFTNSPVAVAVGDFNGDGKLDLAVVNNLLLLPKGTVPHGTVAIFLGGGDGKFSAAPACGGVSSTCNVGTNPLSVAVGDFNGDGKLDLAVANFGDPNAKPPISGNVSILLGHGDGTFGTATNFNVGTGPSYVTVGDFNGDGKPDLAVANHTSNDISILLGDGAGGFTTANCDGSLTPALTCAVKRQPVSIAVGDFKGNGKLDLAVANFQDNNVSILLGAGDGSFTEAGGSPITVGTQPVAVVAGDFNRDGKLDLAVANQTSNSVSVLNGNGDGTFVASAKTFPVGRTPVDMAVGDFNGDGFLDLVTAHFPDKTVVVTLGNGDGTFGTAKAFKTFASQFALAVGDFNGDGKADLAVANGKISILLNTTVFASAGVFNPTANTSVGASAGPQSVAVGDFDRDGNLDLAVANSGTDQVSILLGARDGSFTAATNSPFNVGDQPVSVAVGDFDRDGKPDLAIANFAANTVSILLNTTTSSLPVTLNFGAATDFAVGTNPSSVAVGDFNQDGILDLAIANSGSNNVSILLGNGDGTFTAAAPATVSVGSAPPSIAVGDFDGDGNLDLAVANNGSNNVSILLGNGDGTFTAASGSPVTAGTGPSSVAVGDFNRDGKLDLAVANNGDDNVSILLGNGAGGFTAATPATLAVGTGPSSIAVGDFYQDGKPDLAVANFGSDNISVLLNSPVKITVTVPNGAADTWTIGTTQTIHWTSQGITGNVKIDLSRDSGTTWKNIIKSTPDTTHSASWKVTTPATIKARIRVCSITFPTICDTSDADFTIIK